MLTHTNIIMDKNLQFTKINGLWFGRVATIQRCNGRPGSFGFVVGRRYRAITFLCSTDINTWVSITARNNVHPPPTFGRNSLSSWDLCAFGRSNGLLVTAMKSNQLIMIWHFEQATDTSDDSKITLLETEALVQLKLPLVTPYPSSSLHPD